MASSRDTAMNGSANGREKKERKRKLPTFDFRFDTAFTLRRQPPNSPASTTVSQRIRSESCFFVLLLLFFGLIKVCATRFSSCNGGNLHPYCLLVRKAEHICV